MVCGSVREGEGARRFLAAWRNGLVQKGPFSGNKRTLSGNLVVRLGRSDRVDGRLVPGEAGVAEEFQPMRMASAGQDLRGALVAALRTGAARKAAMVEEELKQS